VESLGFGEELERDHKLAAERISQSIALNSGEIGPWSGGARSLSRKLAGELDLVSGAGIRKKNKQSSAVRNEEMTTPSGYL
jgi:hypothetical protein